MFSKYGYFCWNDKNKIITLKKKKILHIAVRALRLGYLRLVVPMKTKMSAPLLHAFPLQTFTKQLSFGGCWLNFFRCYARHNWNKRRPLRVMVGEESVEFRNLRQAPTSEDPQQSKVVKQTLPDKQSLVFGKKVKFKLPEDIEYERLQEADKRFGYV